jgi:hypothetical protein
VTARRHERSHRRKPVSTNEIEPAYRSPDPTAPSRLLISGPRCSSGAEGRCKHPRAAAVYGPDVIRELPSRVRSIAARSKETTAPFTAGETITQVDRTVGYEEPHDREMPVASALKPSSDSQPRGRRHVLKGIPPVLLSSRAQRRIGSQYLQAATSHYCDKQNIEPMADAYEGGLLLASAECVKHRRRALTKSVLRFCCADEEFAYIAFRSTNARRTTLFF